MSVICSVTEWQTYGAFLISRNSTLHASKSPPLRERGLMKTHSYFVIREHKNITSHDKSQ